MSAPVDGLIARLVAALETFVDNVPEYYEALIESAPAPSCWTGEEG